MMYTCAQGCTNPNHKHGSGSEHPGSAAGKKAAAKKSAVKTKLVAGTKVAKKSANKTCLLYTSPSPRDGLLSRMPSSA